MKIVYTLIDPLTNLPFYVGKGTNKRPLQHYTLVNNNKRTASLRLTSFIKKMIADKREPIIKVMLETKDNSEALILETQLILQYGRIDYEENGILLNHRLAQNDWTGKQHTPESKIKISNAKKGKSVSPETKNRLRLMNIGCKRPPRSEEWKAKQRESHLGRKDSPTAFINKSNAQSGANNPRAKIWLIQNDDSTVFQIKALKPWCKENNLSFNSLTKTKSTGNFYNGLRVIS